ncbi:kinase-like domain-containing protein [Lanmaoa asiatica]|nr:kinase-like domain-containing protein [Lanmaoa asiatica]
MFSRSVREMVHTLQAIHEKGYVHRDVKPDNIMLPLDGKLRPHLVDFGHARRYEEAKEGKHGSLHTVGTLPFMSIIVHEGMPYGRRDDILSFVYTLIYLSHGTLPWYRCESASQCLKKRLSFRPSQLNPPLDAGLQSLLCYAQSLRYD